jgi:lactoylglutathione lyase
MIKHVSVVAITVSDQDAALDFWVNKVGFEQRADVPVGDGYRWLEVAPPGATTRISLEKGEGDQARRAAAIPEMVFEPDDIRATYEQLSGRGVRFTEPPTPQPWGTQAIFVDPDGNHFVLVQP